MEKFIYKMMTRKDPTQNLFPQKERMEGRLLQLGVLVSAAVGAYILFQQTLAPKASQEEKIQTQRKNYRNNEFETRLFINGEFVHNSSGQNISCVDPTTEEVVCEVEEADHQAVEKAVKSARDAFRKASSWRKISGSQRRDLLLSLAKLFERDAEKLARIESVTSGRILSGALLDIKMIIQSLRYCKIQKFAEL